MDSVRKADRLKELVTRRYELIDKLKLEEDKDVKRSLRRELKAVEREARRFASALIDKVQNDEIREAIYSGMTKA